MGKLIELRIPLTKYNQLKEVGNTPLLIGYLFFYFKSEPDTFLAARFFRKTLY